MRIMGKDLFQVMLDPVMLMLLAASIAALALVIERLVYFRKNRCNTTRGVLELRPVVKQIAELDDAEHEKHQQGKHQRELER